MDTLHQSLWETSLNIQRALLAVDALHNMLPDNQLPPFPEWRSSERSV